MWAAYHERRSTSVVRPLLTKVLPTAKHAPVDVHATPEKLLERASKPVSEAVVKSTGVLAMARHD